MSDGAEEIRPSGSAGEPPEGSPGAEPLSASGDGSGVHTGDDGHPALSDGARSARDLGGPTAEEDAESSSGTGEGAKGDIRTKGFDSHS